MVIVPNEGLYLPETKTMKVTLFNQYRNETEVIAAPTKLSMLITKYRKTKKESMLITKHSCGRSEGIRRIEVKEKWWKVLTHFFQFPFKTFFGSTFICCNDFQRFANDGLVGKHSRNMIGWKRFYGEIFSAAQGSRYDLENTLESQPWIARCWAVKKY